MSKLSAPPTSLLDIYTGSEIFPIYSTSVTVTGGEAGHGRASGRAQSDDGALDLQFRLPAAMGGPGGATNPEQLFAAGYAACFHGALSLVATKKKIQLTRGLAIKVDVTFGRDPADGLFLLTAVVQVSLPDIEAALARELVEETEKICPYAKMVRQGIHHSVALADSASFDSTDNNAPLIAGAKNLIQQVIHAIHAGQRRLLIGIGGMAVAALGTAWPLLHKRRRHVVGEGGQGFGLMEETIVALPVH